MKPFFGKQAGSLFLPPTSYTGEVGYEIIVPEAGTESPVAALLQIKALSHVVRR